MKNSRAFARRIAALLVLALLVAPASALAATSKPLTKANIWGILKEDAVVYGDLSMKGKHAKMPMDLIVLVTGYSGSTARVKWGSYTGYVASSALKPLNQGTELKAAVRTRVYQRATLNSRYLNVPRGLEVELVELTGNCAKVKHGANVGYMYIGHLLPED